MSQDKPPAAASRPAGERATPASLSGNQPGEANLVHLSAAWFGQAYLWNGLHAILLPVILVGLVPTALKATYLGALTFFGLVLAMLTQPIAGAISDRSGWLGRYGRRRPWIALGTVVDLGLLALLAVSRATSCWWPCSTPPCRSPPASPRPRCKGLLPDRVAPAQRGRASGYKNAAQIAGFVAGVGLGGFFASRGQIGLALVATGVALGSSVLWTLAGRA